MLRCYARNVSYPGLSKEPQRCAAATGSQPQRDTVAADWLALLLKRRRCRCARRRGGLSQHLFDTTTAVAAWPAHTAHEGDSSQPSFVCHHPWDTIMIHAETIALAGLVNSLHTSRPVPRSLRYQARESRKRDYEVLDAFVTDS